MDEDFKIYLLDAFYLEMLGEFPANLRIEELTLADARRFAHFYGGVVSVVGHIGATMAHRYALEVEIDETEATVSLTPRHSALVGRVVGATIRWFYVSVLPS